MAKARSFELLGLPWLAPAGPRGGQMLGACRCTYPASHTRPLPPLDLKLPILRGLLDRGGRKSLSAVFSHCLLWFFALM